MILMIHCSGVLFLATTCVSMPRSRVAVSRAGSDRFAVLKAASRSLLFRLQVKSIHLPSCPEGGWRFLRFPFSRAKSASGGR